MPKLEENMPQEKIQQIINDYKNNISLRQLEKKYGYSRSALSRMLTRLNIKKINGNHYRTYFFDFDYFEIINTQNKAYWLGLLYADGCIITYNYGQQCFKLALQEQDRQSLKDFKEDLNSTYPIRYDNSKNQKNINWQKQVILEQRSQKTVDDLKRLGCVERKSLILTFPTKEQVPNELIYHFIRGYFDGDGSIFINSNGAYDLSFVGTESFIKTLSTYFQRGSIVKDNRKINSWYLKFGGRQSVINVCDKMYENANRYMKRKYDKYQEMRNMMKVRV